MITENLKEKIELQLEGLELLEEAIAKHLSNCLKSICDMRCEYSEDEEVKRCIVDRDSCKIYNTEEIFLAKIKSYDIRYYVGEYCGLFEDKSRRYFPHTVEDGIYDLCKKIAAAKKFLEEIANGKPIYYCDSSVGLHYLKYNSFSDETARSITDVELYPIWRYKAKGVSVDLNTGEIYECSGNNCSNNFHVFRVTKMYLYEDDFGITKAYIPDYHNTEAESNPAKFGFDSMPNSRITTEQIKRLKAFGQTDYADILRKVKTALLHDKEFTTVFFITIKEIRYGYRSGQPNGQIKIAVISDEKGNNITIADFNNIANHLHPMQTKRNDGHLDYLHMFYDVKPEDLIGNTLIAHFYKYEDKIYAEPIAVVTDENIVYFQLLP
ncbi:MAG: hypothetical protein LBM93_02425 [Oscillospiraceae bacterium]|jgi:hypothetical protein|nr:hypothetical protein [Oscillospiraceae bacterium]